MCTHSSLEKKTLHDIHIELEKPCTNLMDLISSVPIDVEFVDLLQNCLSKIYIYIVSCSFNLVSSTEDCWDSVSILLHDWVE